MDRKSALDRKFAEMMFSTQSMDIDGEEKSSEYEKFRPKSDDYYPKKPFECHGAAPSVSPSTEEQWSRSMADKEAARQAEREIKAKLMAKAREAHDALEGRAFLGSNSLRGDELKRFDAEKNKEYSMLQARLLRDDVEGEVGAGDEFMPRSKIDMSSKNPWMDFSLFRSLGRENASDLARRGWPELAAPVIAYVASFLSDSDQISMARVNVHWSQNVGWSRLSRSNPSALNPFSGICAGVGAGFNAGFHAGGARKALVPDGDVKTPARQAQNAYFKDILALENLELGRSKPTRATSIRDDPCALLVDTGDTGTKRKRRSNLSAAKNGLSVSQT